MFNAQVSNLQPSNEAALIVRFNVYPNDAFNSSTDRKQLQKDTPLTTNLGRLSLGKYGVFMSAQPSNFQVYVPETGTWVEPMYEETSPISGLNRIILKSLELQGVFEDGELDAQDVSEALFWWNIRVDFPMLDKQALLQLREQGPKSITAEITLDMSPKTDSANNQSMVIHGQCIRIISVGEKVVRATNPNKMRIASACAQWAQADAAPVEQKSLFKAAAQGFVRKQKDQNMARKSRFAARQNAVAATNIQPATPAVASTTASTNVIPPVGIPDASMFATAGMASLPTD